MGVDDYDTSHHSVLPGVVQWREASAVHTLERGTAGRPYLTVFVLISSSLKHHSLSSELHGLMVAPSAPAVSHLLFVDDSLLLFKQIRRA
jgi:hypothetical protein